MAGRTPLISRERRGGGAEGVAGGAGCFANGRAGRGAGAGRAAGSAGAAGRVGWAGRADLGAGIGNERAFPPALAPTGGPAASAGSEERRSRAARAASGGTERARGAGAVTGAGRPELGSDCIDAARESRTTVSSSRARLDSERGSPTTV